MTLLPVVLVFLVAAIVIVPLGKRLGLSSVLGYLVTGLAIGPGGLNLITDADSVLHFAELGVVLLLFIIGLELLPRRLWVMRQLVFGLGAVQVAVTTAVIAAALMALFSLDFAAALVIGFSVSLSSTAFVLQLLGEQHKLNKPHGRAAFGVLLLQDVAVIPAIAVLNAIASANGIEGGHAFNPVYVAIVVAGLVGARYVLRPALRFVAASGIRELFSAAALAIVIGAALAMEVAGLSMGLGAFIAGMMVADSEYRHQLETDVNPFKGLLLGLFFISVGMVANLELLAAKPLLVIALALSLVAIKALLIVPMAWYFKRDIAEALRTALVLSQGGEFAFVLLTAGVGAGLVSASLSEIGILVVTLSMVTTPLLVALGDKLLSRGEQVREFDAIDAPPKLVVIAGFGRFAQIVARVLAMRGIAFTALESSPGQVDVVRSFGNEIYYGDATRLDLLRNAHVEQASAFVLAVDDADTSVRIAKLVREVCPKVTILARARDRNHEIRLRELGVNLVIRDTLLSSLSLSCDLLKHLGFSEEEAELSIKRFREHDERTLLKQAAVFHDDAAYRQAAMDAIRQLQELFNEDASEASESREATS